MKFYLLAISACAGSSLKRIPVLALSASMAIIFVGSFAQAEECRKEFRDGVNKNLTVRGKRALTPKEFEDLRKNQPDKQVFEESSVAICELTKVKTTLFSAAYRSLCPASKSLYRQSCLREYLTGYKVISADVLDAVMVIIAQTAGEDKKMQNAFDQAVIVQMIDSVFFVFEQLKFNQFLVNQVNGSTPENKKKLKELQERELATLKQMQTEFAAASAEKIQKLKERSIKEPAPNKETQGWIKVMLQQLEVRMGKMKSKVLI